MPVRGAWLTLLLAVLVRAWECPCSFAAAPVDAHFVTCMSYFEGSILQAAYWPAQGLTKDGAFVDPRGSVSGTPRHNFSAASKESLHVAMLALAIDGNTDAQLFVARSTGCATLGECSAVAASRGVQLALDAAALKMAALERFNATYSGFAGFLPWFTVANGTGSIVPLSDWLNRVPALDNGQLIWALMALDEALRRTGAAPPLQARVGRYIDALKRNSVSVFYAGGGSIRSVALIKNVTAPPVPSNYATEGGFLVDPYEGELFTQFAYLFGVGFPDPQSDRELIWAQKRAALVPVQYHNTTVQQGFWFSAHEQWKYLYAPYLDVDIHVKLFGNGEKARAHSAASRGGLRASVNNVTHAGRTSYAPNYMSACGVAGLGSQRVDPFCPVTPYGAFPMMLINRTAGLLWWRSMVATPAMHSPYGSLEAISVDGSLICPLLTWDAKITSVVAALGGIAHLTRAYLVRHSVAADFYGRITSEWARAFPSIATGLRDYALPPRTPLRSNLTAFPGCA